MKVHVIADLISRAQEDGELRARIAKGDFPVELSHEERKAVREAILRMERGEAIPPHMFRQDPFLVWLCTHVEVPYSS